MEVVEEKGYRLWVVVAWVVGCRGWGNRGSLESRR